MLFNTLGKLQLLVTGGYQQFEIQQYMYMNCYFSTASNESEFKEALEANNCAFLNSYPSGNHALYTIIGGVFEL